jgi:hypothetical protein
VSGDGDAVRMRLRSQHTDCFEIIVPRQLAEFRREAFLARNTRLAPASSREVRGSAGANVISPASSSVIARRMAL